MSLLNKVRLGSSLLGSKISGHSAPLIINWAITGKCNLRCTHCYGSYGRVQNEELSFDTITKTIDEARELGTKRITIEGGEPLVRHDVAEIIDYISKAGMEMSLCTNGVLLGRYAEKIKDKIDLIVLSLDGNEAHHDKIRGAGNFRKVMEAVETAKQNKLRVLLFSCLIDENMADIDYLVKLAEEKGVKSAFNIAVSKLKDAGKREEGLKLSDETYRKAVAQIIAAKAKGAPIYYSDRNFNQALCWPTFTSEKLFSADIEKLSAAQRKTLVRCFAGKHFCYIESSGGVYPCYQTVGTLTAGNIKDAGGLKGAFDNLSKLEYCKACYNVTLSELNLQCRLDFKSVLKVGANYFGRK